MGDLTKPQREAALAVLAAALSPQGYEKVLQIVEADEVLIMLDFGFQLSQPSFAPLPWCSLRYDLLLTGSALSASSFASTPVPYWVA